MTSQEFLKYVLERSCLSADHGSYDRNKLESNICNTYHDEYNAEKILDFFEHIGRVYFYRTESVSGDMLVINICWQAYICRWENIGEVVNGIGSIRNGAGWIDEFYMSEKGRFYNKDRGLIAENENDFFDFLTSVEYDFHPIVSEKVYDVLRGAGWFEGRRIDVSEFNEKMMERGVFLSQAQLDFLSEFSGIGFSFKSEFCRFYSLSEILDNCDTCLDDNGNPMLAVAENMGPPYYIDQNGILDGLTDVKLGRTAIEGLNFLVKETFGWGDIDEPVIPQKNSKN